jgi:hypothetical protein
MPALMIQLINGQWVAEVSNTEIHYAFLGATLDAQTQRVQFLAANMAYNGEDIAAFNAQIGRALDLAGATPEEVTEQLYATTDAINYAGRMVYAAVGDEVLLDVLEEAGEALLLALGI